MPARQTRAALLLTVVGGLLMALPGSAMQAAHGPGLPAEWTSPWRVALAAVSPEGYAEALAATAPAEVKTAQTRLPACEYKDQLTRFHKVRDWRKTLLDTTLRLRKSYKPWDLVSVSRAGIAGSGLVRKVIIADLRAMAAAARKAGKPLAVRSAYRSYATQVATFNSWVRRSGYQQALKFSARPGHSEHQLGTTVDFTTAPGVPLSTSFGESPPGKWIARHGWKYGFIMSYPKGRKKASCYGYEPWHWRYVGKKMARAIHESGQVPRRYLWENVESVP
jgi:zinc D-Ala-D-Ala carboxypeptidase